MDKKTYYCLQFFMGKFDIFFEECQKHKDSLGWSYNLIQTAVYLWMLLLNEDNNSNIYQSLLNNVFYDLGFNKESIFLDNSYSEIFNKWKTHFNISEKEKKEYLEWLQIIVNNRIDAIVGGSHRKSYHKAAFLVVSLGEVLEANNIETKGQFIDFYQKKYSRRSAFRQELDKLL